MAALARVPRPLKKLRNRFTRPPRPLRHPSTMSMPVKNRDSLLSGTPVVAMAFSRLIVRMALMKKARVRPTTTAARAKTKITRATMTPAPVPSTEDPL